MPRNSKDANKAYWCKWYAANKEKHIASQQKFKDRIASVVRTGKEKPCADCKVQYPYYVMDYDHLSDKEFTIAKMGKRIGYKKLLAELAKCEVVCSNCHRKRTWDRSH